MDVMPKRPPPANLSPVIASVCKEVRRQDLTAYAIAKSCGLPISTVQRALDGSTSPTLSTLEAIASALGMRIKAEVK